MNENKRDFIESNIHASHRTARGQYVKDSLSVFVKRRRGEPVSYVQSDAFLLSLDSGSALKLAHALIRGVESHSDAKRVS